MSVTQDLRDKEDLPTFLAAAATAVKEGRPLEVLLGDRRAQLDKGDAELLIQLLQARSKGLRVNIHSIPETITTGQAADILGVSRPTVVKMIEDGRLEAHRTSTHRKVSAAAVLRLKSEADAAITPGLDELAALSDELGLRGT